MLKRIKKDKDIRKKSKPQTFVELMSSIALVSFQDSTGMKLWKKRWFVLSDLCLFYYRGEFSPVI